MQIHVDRHRARRAALNETLGEGVLVLPTARPKNRNNDSDYRYRFDSSFYYLTGFQEPEAVLVQVLGPQPRSILFCQPKNQLQEIWEGFVYGPEAAMTQFGFDEAYSIERFDGKLAELLDGAKTVYFPIGADEQWDRRILAAVEAVRGRSKFGAVAPVAFADVRAAINEMRLFKDEAELGIMREACRISAEAHVRAMQVAKPGDNEYQIEAELLYHFYRNGSRYPAYTSIVASGPNATCLHYQENNRRMADGDLLLIDAGCELQGYAADITRTFPVNGRFSGPQRDIYELVLAAMQASFAQVKAGVPRIAYHDAAVRTLTQGLVDLKILRGEVDGLIESEAYKQFYMHGTGHWLGLDVHDAGEYRLNGESRLLEPGMVLTVEPGLYFRPLTAESPSQFVEVPAHFMHIGVRIEDDVLVTAEGLENFCTAAPKAIADIEALMAA